ncbi:hypothetical protein V0R55_24680 [Pseudomonas soli]|uniref:Uncharacterized protein n=1 Tax=Pseudomonas soli TaxID=1306993 RepID=A0ABU7GWC9_9PSED|nr:hypothetical protein [Pseudomonas soli]MEE1883364.1 hypothetical protein [Pseudomonas soli]
MMTVHPLFAGFSGVPLGFLGRALGFELLAESRSGPLPPALSFADGARLDEGGDLAGYRFAGGWEVGAQHCLLFARPTTYSAGRLWDAALRSAQT